MRQSCHLAAVPLEELSFAEARVKGPPVHLMLPKEHATLLVPRDNGDLEPHVLCMQALQQVREVEWRSLAARTKGHTPLAGGSEAVPLGAVYHGSTHRNLLRPRDGCFFTMQVLRWWRPKVTSTVTAAHPCIFCGGPDGDTGQMLILCAPDKAVTRVLREFIADLL